MTWSVAAVGTKAAVRVAVEKQFDDQIATYSKITNGAAEGSDIAATKERVLSLIDEITVDSYANGIEVKASGARSVGFAGSGSFSVQRVLLTL